LERGSGRVPVKTLVFVITRAAVAATTIAGISDLTVRRLAARGLVCIALGPSKVGTFVSARPLGRLAASRRRVLGNVLDAGGHFARAPAAATAKAAVVDHLAQLRVDGSV
jgi:hypothetical protein